MVLSRRHARASLVFAAVLCLAACSGEQYQNRLVGTWDAQVAGQDAAQTNGTSVTVEFTAGGEMNWEIQEGGITNLVEGRWEPLSEEGDTLKIQTYKGSRGQNLYVTFFGGDRCKITKKSGDLVMALSRI